MLGFRPLGAGPLGSGSAESTSVSISNITDPITTGQNFTINGNNFKGSQGSSTVTLGGVSCSIVSWGNTQIVATCPTIELTSLKYGQQVIVVNVA